MSYVPRINYSVDNKLSIRGFTDSLPIGKTYFRTDLPRDGCCGLSELIELEKTIPRGKLEKTISRRNLEKTISRKDFRDSNITFNTDNSTLPTLCIGVALYNEPPEELRRVLVSIADQVKEMENIANCSLVLVSDGHAAMDPRTRKYIRALFCNNKSEEISFDNLIASMDEYCSEKAMADEDERVGTPIENRKPAPPPLTYVLQKVKSGKRMNIRIRGAKDRNEERFLKATLILKTLNRRKHNSQEWMFNYAENFAFKNSKLTESDYIFLTDCGTLFESGCLIRMISYMKAHPLCVGCTGRQRVMSAEEQDSSGEGWLEKYFRMVQMADYEGSYATYTGAFSLAGCLPVLPGPCCMLRFSALNHKRRFKDEDPLERILSGNFSSEENYSNEPLLPNSNVSKMGKIEVINREGDVEINFSSNMEKEILENTKGNRKEKEEEVKGEFSPNNPSDLTSETPSDETDDLEISLEKSEIHTVQETALEHFKKLVGTGPGETNLVIENVKLAEDRIPSYAIVTHGERGAYTCWIDGSVFKFQAETSLESFAKQRRRWINGAFFSYVWNVFIRPDLICGSSHFFPRKILIWTLFFLQLITYLLASISPSIFAAGLYLGLISLFLGEGQIAILISTILFSAYTFFFIWVHRYRPFVKPMFYLMACMNTIAMIFTLSGYIRQAIAWDFSPTGIDRAIIQWSIIAIMASPFFMAIVSLNFKSLFLLIKSCIPYWFFLPTMIGTFTMYGMARMGDQSWGNRAGAAGSNFKNVSQKQLTDLQNDFSSNSLVALIFLTVLNITIEAIVIYFGVNSWFIVGVLALVFSTTFIQMVLSIIYFLGKHISGLTFWERYSLCRCCGRRENFSESL